MASIPAPGDPPITTDDEFANVILEIFQADGVTPAVVDGVPTWLSSDDTILHVIPNADGMGGVVMCVAPGTAHIAITGDADMGSGVVSITGVSDDVTVTAGVVPASLMKVTLGAPTKKV